MDIDTIIEAIGQRPDTSFISDGDIKVGRGGTIVADPRTLATGRPGVFAGGDAATGPWTVIEAIAAGQRAASSIKRYLRGEELSPLIERDGYKPIAFSQVPPTDEETRERPRVEVARLAGRERATSFEEILFAYSPEGAREEASRCLRCDLQV